MGRGKGYRGIRWVGGLSGRTQHGPGRYTGSDRWFRSWRNDADNIVAVVLANRFQKVFRVWHFALRQGARTQMERLNFLQRASLRPAARRCPPLIGDTTLEMFLPVSVSDTHSAIGYFAEADPSGVLTRRRRKNGLGERV